MNEDLERQKADTKRSNIFRLSAVVFATVAIADGSFLRSKLENESTMNFMEVAAQYPSVSISMALLTVLSVAFALASGRRSKEP